MKRAIYIITIIFAVMSLIGCSHNYPTPYPLRISREKSAAESFDATKSLAVLAISLDAQHWQITKIDKEAGIVFANYKETSGAVKVDTENSITVYSVDSEGNLLEASEMKSRYILSLRRALREFKVLTQDQIDNQLKSRNIQF